VFSAPLVVGGVHRVPMILLMVTCGLGLGALVLGAASEHRPLRVGISAALPLVLFAIPVLQSIPLPLALRGLLDPHGNAILLDSDLPLGAFWPLSLDPAPTREHIGRAAAAFAIFLVAYHLASGKTRRHVLPRLVALSGIVAVVVGLGHHLFGVSEIYGSFAVNNRSLMTGPFVNSNHTAELLELAAFVCLACSFQRNTAINRYGWLTGALLCAVGAIGTLSRGTLVGLLAGMSMFALLRYLAKEDSSGQRARTWIAWGALASVLIVVTAGALGAGALVDRFRESAVSGDVRFQLWRDSLKVLGAHPLGIGRGAFERVYPIYRTIKNWYPVTYAYVESHPLQLLIDSGWLLFGLIVASLMLVVLEIVRRGRRDTIEAALLAGLFAITAHSFVDFGLETLGVLLPFVAILGTVMGRSAGADDSASPNKVAPWLATLACAGLVFGAVAVAHPSDDDFDKLLKEAHGTEQVRAVLRRAQAVHPTDYFFALAFAKTEPLRPSGGKSPRLHALNRALRLCPGCEFVHVEVARSLWSLGLHAQALVEWRMAAEIEPYMFPQVMDELARLGAKPKDLAAVASFDAGKMVQAAEFLATRSQVADALVVLDEADLMGAPRTESLLTRGRLQLQSNQVAAAQTTLAEAHALGIQDPRLAVLEAQLVLAVKGPSGADEALSILDLAAIRYPLDLPLQRMRISLVSGYSKWQAADRAIDGLKLALYHSVGSGFEADLAAARIRSRLSQWNAAITEYRIALNQSANQPSLWVELAEVAERAGRDTVAHEAYSEAARLAPADTTISGALRRLDARQNQARGSDLAPGAGGQWRAP
jgi:tetratricopeptide (TPR) repeat protein